MEIDSSTLPDDDSHYVVEGISPPVGGIGDPLRGPSSYFEGSYDWRYGSSGVGLGSAASRSSQEVAMEKKLHGLYMELENLHMALKIIM